MNDASSEFVTAAQALDRIAIDNLRRALEIGRWPDGRALSEAQREVCLQTVIAWERVHLPENARSGRVPPAGACSEPESTPRPIRIVGGDE